MNGDSSEETQAKKQQLQSDLKDAQADLEETQYQQWLTDQEKLMDSTFDAYSEFLSSRLDNIDGLLQDFIDYGNQNSDKVNQTITDATNNVGYTISDGMKSIWNSTDSGIGKILTEYNGNFMSSMSTISEYLLYIFHKMGGLTKEEAEEKRLKDEAERKRQEELRRQQQQAEQQRQQQQQAQQQQSKQPQIGSMINAGGARIYSNSYGGGGGRQYFANDPLYTIVGENNGYWLVRWHNLSSGYTGWFRKGDVTAMATGGYTGNSEGMAMLHAKERVLSAQQTKAFETLVYNFLPKMSDELSRVSNLRANASAIYNRGNGTSSIENSIDLTVTLPNVQNGSDFVKALQTDKNVQKIIKSFTIDEAMGKNSLRRFNIK